MNEFENLLNEIDDEPSVADRVMEINGEDVVMVATSPEDERLIAEDFPKYSRSERSIIVRVNEILEEKSQEALFSTEDEEITEFEKKILDIIRKV